MSPGVPWGRAGERIGGPGNAAVGPPQGRRASGKRGKSASRSRERGRSGSGYWQGPMVEPKGYFDQLYMGSSGEGAYEAVEREILKEKDEGQEEGVQRTPSQGSGSGGVPRPPGLESRSSQETGSSEFEWRSTSMESVETAATTEGTDSPAGVDLSLSSDMDGSKAQPRLQHAHSVPARKLEGESLLGRRTTMQ